MAQHGIPSKSPKDSPNNSTTSSSPTSPGGTVKVKRIGGYILNEMRGEGRFGKVYRATHDDGNSFAIKVCPKTSSRIAAEIRILQRLPPHPNVIQLFELLETENNYYIVMELANMSLFQLILSNGKLSEGAARPLFKDIVAGLKHCHDNRVSHRDIKPENVLIVERTGGQVRAALADFGWAYLQANPADEQSLRQTFCGSLNYMAPEFFSETLCYNPYLADVWSLGIVLFAMVAGYFPYEGKNESEFVANLHNSPPRYPRSMSPALKHLIEHLLVLTPATRSTLDFALEHPWTTSK